ncbi:hypothetical protein [Priestia sp. YIM B13486]|uniref:hypothetical protein n=1 Tax=Priestia sp. YIM B13486 TaxID=3366304 RepID=UPI00366B36F8
MCSRENQSNHCQCNHNNNCCQCNYCQSYSQRNYCQSDPSNISIPQFPQPAIVSGFIPANGENPQKIEGDFTVTKNTQKPGVYVVRYIPPFSELPPGTSNPVMIQAFRPLESINYSNCGFGSNTDDVFAFAVVANVQGFKYITFEIVNDHVVQKDLDAKFTSLGLR